MKYYYITKSKSKERHAGGKAPNDIDLLCSKRGWKRLVYPDYRHKNLFFRVLRSFAIECFWLAFWVTASRNSIVFYQHPMRCGAKIATKFIPAIQSSKNIKFVALIHDLDSVRHSDIKDSVRFEDEALLKVFDVLICHNKHMKEYLIKKGIPDAHIVCLQLFDYLVVTDETADSEDGFAVAGNLSKEKCKYVYDLVELSSNTKVYAYGVNFEEGSSASNFLYQGSYNPDELPAVLKGRFGIVWDGDSIDVCAGDYGEYMRLNNPHKLSLYMAAGKPVVCWRQAAIADFVLENGVGIAVDSLREALSIVNHLSESSYDSMKNNVMFVRNRVISGYYFYRAADEAIRIIEGKRCEVSEGLVEKEIG